MQKEMIAVLDVAAAAAGNGNSMVREAHFVVVVWNMD